MLRHKAGAVRRHVGNDTFGVFAGANFLIWGCDHRRPPCWVIGISTIKLPWETVELVGLLIEIRWPPVARRRRLCNRWTAHGPGAS
jgi:hypothetical protein